MEGAWRAQAEVVVFLDSHIEAGKPCFRPDSSMFGSFWTLNNKKMAMFCDQKITRRAPHALSRLPLGSF